MTSVATRGTWPGWWSLATQLPLPGSGTKPLGVPEDQARSPKKERPFGPVELLACKRRMVLANEAGPPSVRSDRAAKLVSGRQAGRSAAGVVSLG